MKKLAPIILALWLGLATSAPAGQDRNAVARLHELVLPEFTVEGVSLEEGLAIVRSAWEEKHPGESFPVVVVQRLDHRADPSPELGATMYLKNVPALDVVGYLAVVHGLKVRHGLDLVILRPVLALDEEAWTSVMLSLSDASISALELSREADGDREADEALKEMLTELGLSFTPGFDVRWYGGSRQLFVRNTPEEVSKLKGILMLFESGYSVTKREEPDPED